MSASDGIPPTPIDPAGLRAWFGEIDIYLFDQLLRGRIRPGASVLDAGCGGGRNLVYLLRAGFPVHAVDLSPEAVARVRALAAELAPGLPPGNFRVAAVEAMPFADASFEVVLSSAVLHFARDEEHFRGMLGEMWRVLRPGGLLFVRLASLIGLEDRVEPVQGRRYRLPDGTERFLVDEAMLLSLGAELGATLADPIKTTHVQNLRCMTTWCLSRPG